MIKVKITENSNMKFYDSKTKKLQWYSTDLLKGEIFTFKDINHSTTKDIFFVCLDDELCAIPIKAFLLFEF